MDTLRNRKNVEKKLAVNSRRSVEGLKAPQEKDAQAVTKERRNKSTTYIYRVDIARWWQTRGGTERKMRSG